MNRVPHRRSRLTELRHLFTRQIVVADIAEPLLAFDANADAAHCRDLLQERRFGVVGVRHGGNVAAFALTEALGEGELGDYEQSIGAEVLVHDDAPILEAIERLAQRRFLLVERHGGVGAIVTRSDLHKHPVRMWLFGLVSLVEMELVDFISWRHPHDEWRQLIKPRRLAYAEKLHAGRRASDMELDLVDCLQFADKRDILLADPESLFGLGVGSKTLAEKTLNRLERTRDVLAHAQPIGPEAWAEMGSLAHRAHAIIESIERTMAEGSG